MIHFNTAGAGLVSLKTHTAVGKFLDAEQRLGAYEAEQKYDPLLTHGLYDSLAQLLGAQTSEIALFDGGTHAATTLLSAIPFKDTETVWISPYEYAGNLLCLQNLQKKYHFHLQVIPLENTGDLDLEWMHTHFHEKVRLVSLPHIPSNCGIVHPIAAIGHMIKSKNPQCLYMVDACQSVGQLPLDVGHIQCDILTAAGRKFLCGPRGTGFAYVSKTLSLKPLIQDLHTTQATNLTTHVLEDPSAKRFELLEKNNAALVGFHQAVREAIVRKQPPNPILYEALLETLNSFTVLETITPGTKRSGIVSAVCPHPKAVMHHLRTQDMNAWAIDGHHTPLYMLPRGYKNALRFSLHYYNTLEHIKMLGEVLRDSL